MTKTPTAVVKLLLKKKTGVQCKRTKHDKILRITEVQYKKAKHDKFLQFLFIMYKWQALTFFPDYGTVVKAHSNHTEKAFKTLHSTSR